MGKVWTVTAILLCTMKSIIIINSSTITHKHKHLFIEHLIQPRHKLICDYVISFSQLLSVVSGIIVPTFQMIKPRHSESK